MAPDVGTQLFFLPTSSFNKLIMTAPSGMELIREATIFQIWIKILTMQFLASKSSNYYFLLGQAYDLCLNPSLTATKETKISFKQFHKHIMSTLALVSLCQELGTPARRRKKLRINGWSKCQIKQAQKHPQK